jgi:DNA-binding NtrC family response regulator
MQITLLHHNAERRALITAHLRDAGLEPVLAASADDVVAAASSHSESVVITDLCVPDLEEGMQLLAQLRGIDAQLPVLALVERNDAATAVEAVRKGAFEVLTPEMLPRLAQITRHAMRARELALQARRLSDQAELNDESESACTPAGRPAIGQVLRGNHASIRKLRTSLLRLARVQTDVLVNGDTGCGKEVVARCLHDYGPRANHHFVAINCGAIPENIFESELFGHEAGAFTGANKRRIGKLEFASGGTVFLDEIESMPMPMQVKLLRALQQRTIERVGGNEAIKLNCRIVAATKDNLRELAQQGRFRMDLYYRLNVIELALPALKDRREDIPLLADAFAKQAAQRHGLAEADAALDVEFVCRLMAHDWPGNVRELANAVERQVLGMPGLADVRADSHDDTPRADFSLAQQVAAFERTLIETSLRACRGSVTKVCEILAVPRKTLYDKLTRFSVDPAQFRAEQADRSANTLGRISYAPALAH